MKFSAVILTVSLLFAAKLFSDSWLILGTFALTALLGWFMHLRLVELIIVTLPFHTYLSLWEGSLFNFSPSLILLLVAITRPEFFGNVKVSVQRSGLTRHILIWASVLIIALIASLLVNANEIGFENWTEFSKVLVGMVFALWAFFEFKSMSPRVRADSLKLWVLSATVIACVALVLAVMRAFTTTELLNGFFYSSGLRMTGSFEDPNLFATYLALSIGLAVIGTGISVRLKRIAAFVPLVAALALTGSRAALVSIIIFTLVGIILSVRVRRWLVSWLAKVVGASGAILVVTIPLFTIFASVIRDALGLGTIQTALQRLDFSGDTRFKLWESGVEMWQSSPFFGVGYGEFSDRSAEFGNRTDGYYSLLAHNTFVTFLAETGIFGFVTLLIPIGFALVLLVKQRNYSAIGAAAAVVGTAVMMFSLNLQNSGFIWVFFGGVWAWVSLRPTKTRAYAFERRYLAPDSH